MNKIIKVPYYIKLIIKILNLIVIITSCNYN